MQWKTKLGSVIASWLLGLPQALMAASFEVGFYNYPPMMIESDKSGIYQDIFNAIGKLTGDTFNIRYYPYPRISLMFNEARLDIEPGVYPGWVRDQKIPGLFSAPFGKVVDVVVFASGKAFPVDKPEALSGKSVGMVRGYAYPDLQALMANGQIDRRNGLDENQLLKMLHAERFDQIIINKAVAQYNIFKFPEYRLLEVGDVLDSYDVSMRVSPKLELWLPKLDEAILKLKSSGVIDKIYAKYGVKL
jgi:polar amino acid transport system substrate-binding protein